MLATYEILVIVMLGSFIALIFTGFPIAWILGGLAVVFAVVGVLGAEFLDLDTYFLTDWRIFGVIVQRIYAQMANWVLVALPMFIFMGLFLEKSGVARDLMVNLSSLLGRVHGGLAVSVAVIGILLAASTGIIGASVVLLTLMGLPAMLEAGYNKAYAAGVICAVGTLGILVPPSIMLVLMADRLAVSVGDLFMGALIPGVTLGLLYMVYVVLVAVFNPSAAPRPNAQDRLTIGEIFWAFLSTLPTIGLILVVLGSIFFGIATPTEASGLGAFGATLLALANGRLNLKVLRTVGYQTTLTTCFIFAIFIGATVFAFVLRSLGGDELISGIFKGLGLGPNGLIMVVLAVVFVAGFFLDWFEVVLIVLPLLAPVIKELGIDMTWFLVIVAVMLQTSFLTPPVGFSLFYLKGAAPKSVTIKDIYVGVLPFVALQMLMVVACFMWPEIITWLPRQMYGSVAP